MQRQRRGACPASNFFIGRHAFRVLAAGGSPRDEIASRFRTG
jgi:hypothetical protein